MTVKEKRPSKTLAHISSAEWSWVIGVSLVLFFVISIPFAWALWQNRTMPDYQFMGFVTNPLDGGTYLSKIQLGKEGHWRTYFRHSPELDSGAYLDLVYTTLGHISRFLGLSNLFVFHAFRFFASMLMMLGLYQLGAMIWSRIRTRRMFFILVIIGSGFGWLWLIITGGQGDFRVPDLTIPEAFPLYSAMANIHFPLAFALVSLTIAVLIRAFRPGFYDEPTVDNGGLVVFISSLLLAVMSPHVLVPLASAVGLVILIEVWQKRKISWNQLRWLMMIVLPALPFAVYYMAEVRYNPVVAEWSAQNQTLTPNPFIYLIGLGLPLIIAVPGIVRAVRRFEPDGDQLMLLWLLSIVVLLYIPTDFQRRFSMGIMIPIAYFAVRGMEDYWFKRIKKRWYKSLQVAVYAVSGLGYVFLLVLSFAGASSEDMETIYLDADYVIAFDWLQQQEHDEVVLASEYVGTWLPGWAGQRVVYGHPFETLHAEVNLSALMTWYAAENPDDDICAALLTQYNVRYVLWGPSEQAYGEAACIDNLTLIEQFDDVAIYQP